MHFKALRIYVLAGLIARRLLFRAFMLASALSLIPFVQIISGSDPILLDYVNFHECDSPFMITGTNLFQHRFLKPIWNSFECKEDVNLTTDVVRVLMVKQLLDYNAKALYVGEGSASAVYALRELGFSNACGSHRHPFFSLKHRKFVYELQYPDNSFEFVLSRDLDKVSVPAALVLEIERVLKPGGIGAMLVGVIGLNPNGLIRSATPVSSLLKASNVVHVSYVHEYTLVVFQKSFEKVGYFEQFRLPADCQSFLNNRPFMKHLEPLVEKKEMGFEKKISFLPNFSDVPSRKKLVYVEIGAADRLNNSSVANWSIPNYPVDHKVFDIYFVDHNASVLLSHVKKPGVTFIYYPGLAGDKITASISDGEDLEPSVEDEGFDILSWFRETVGYADFVIVKMKAGEAELKFLTDLYESGVICFVDELFLSCSDHVDDNGVVSKDCMDILKSLRSSGMYVHQWWRD